MVMQSNGKGGYQKPRKIVSGRSGSGYLLVVVERKTRYVFIEQINTVTIDEVHRAFLKIQKKLPEMKALTLNNDLLFAMHKTLEKLLGLPIYFCHPYHSWKKGSVENANKYIRKYIPKGGDLSQYDKKFIRCVEKRCNGRFMDVLRYKKPIEKLKESRWRSKKQRELRCEKRKEHPTWRGVAVGVQLGQNNIAWESPTNIPHTKKYETSNFWLRYRNNSKLCPRAPAPYKKYLLESFLYSAKTKNIRSSYS